MTARWDRNRVLFSIEDAGESYDCAISREALQDISDRRYGKPVELLACFEKARPRLEGIARQKLHAHHGAITGVVTIWSGDLDEAAAPDA